MYLRRVPNSDKNEFPFVHKNIYHVLNGPCIVHTCTIGYSLLWQAANKTDKENGRDELTNFGGILFSPYNSGCAHALHS